jgi:hypothetical protein
MDRSRLSLLELPLHAARRSARRAWELQQRERERLWVEMGHTRGLMPLLMKQRNGVSWSVDDRRALRLHLRQLAGLSPYLVLLIAPGGLLALPALAWWLDRRRQRRPDPR